MNNVPKSPTEKIGGMVYFPRMLSKIRLFAAEELRPDFHANLGKGADEWCTTFLRIDYEALKNRVLAGGSDETFSSGVTRRDADSTKWIYWCGIASS